MDNKTIANIIGYITIAIGTIGLFGEISLYHRFLQILETFESTSAGGISLGAYFVIAFITMLPPTVVLIGFSLIAKNSGSKSKDEVEKQRRTERKPGGGL